MEQDMIDGTLARLTAYAQSVPQLDDALSSVLRAAEDILQHQWPGSEQHGTELHALFALLTSTRARTAAYSHQIAAQLGWQVATYRIAPIARESGIEPVVFITGNSHVPSLRAFDVGDLVWALANDDPDVWGSYSDAIERRCDELHVYLGEPEYDNALYVVDLARFEHTGEADDLSLEWSAIEPPQ